MNERFYEHLRRDTWKKGISATLSNNPHFKSKQVLNASGKRARGSQWYVIEDAAKKAGGQRGGGSAPRTDGEEEEGEGEEGEEEGEIEELDEDEDEVDNALPPKRRGGGKRMRRAEPESSVQGNGKGRKATGALFAISFSLASFNICLMLKTMMTF